MNKLNKLTKLFFIIILNMLWSSTLIAQSKAQIDNNVDFYQEGTDLIITYDIVKATPAETFTIWVRIYYTASGREINAYSLSGDIGKDVRGGQGKRIVWDMQADNVTIDDEIHVQILAKSNIQPKVKTEKKVSVGQALLLSAILPGLGNMKAKGGGAYWLIGVAGYGLIGGSIAMNSAAYNAYEKYKKETSASKRDDLFNDAGDKEQTSKIMFGSAIGIWVIDLIWTGIQAGQANKKYRESKLSMNYTYNPFARQPMILLTYKF